MNEVQIKIRDIVKDYVKLFPDEYKLVCEYLKEKRTHNKDKFASFKGKDIRKTDGVVERALYEIPETLDNLFMMKLSMEDKKYYKTKECARWFANNFIEFKSGELV